MTDITGLAVNVPSVIYVPSRERNVLLHAGITQYRPSRPSLWIYRARAKKLAKKEIFYLSRASYSACRVISFPLVGTMPSVSLVLGVDKEPEIFV